MGKQYKGRRKAGALDAAFFQRLRSSDDVDMALMVRASRNLPIRLLAGEYERILRRRLAVVGGSPDDAALAQMVTCFRCRSLTRTFTISFVHQLVASQMFRVGGIAVRNMRAAEGLTLTIIIARFSCQKRQGDEGLMGTANVGRASHRAGYGLQCTMLQRS